eukprot:NODE_8114_length_401_cov_134.546243.p2 GENE.NODE_8114_length_401_cov_134.546243~~NODE_8114_length_401_cov_134.546243.p2  ORF type:complete len:88 (+),score=15.43 NODE_8114_length_401_cov_134.546243:3-266(+)
MGDVPNIGLGPDFRRVVRGNIANAELGDSSTLGEAGNMGHAGDETGNADCLPGAAGGGVDSRADAAARQPERARGVGRVSLWPGGQS